MNTAAHGKRRLVVGVSVPPAPSTAFDCNPLTRAADVVLKEKIAQATAADVDAAVEAASRGFHGPWRKMHGYGREQGVEALESYMQYKTIWANVGE